MRDFPIFLQILLCVVLVTVAGPARAQQPRPTQPYPSAPAQPYSQPYPAPVGAYPQPYGYVPVASGQAGVQPLAPIASGPNVSLLVAGGVLASIGVGLAVLGIAVLAGGDTNDETVFKRGVAASAAGGALVVGGVVMLGVGATSGSPPKQLRGPSADLRFGYLF